MNRIILIGNGFDLAHGLPTGYKDFINSYWKTFAHLCYKSDTAYEDEFAKLERINAPESRYDAYIGANFFGDPESQIFLLFAKEVDNINSYNELKQLIEKTNKLSELKFKIIFNNEFFGHISEKFCLQSWLDIENEYYNKLKDCLKQDDENRSQAVEKLNHEFEQIKTCQTHGLEDYLTEVCKKEVTEIESITNAIATNIEYRDIAISKREVFFNLPNKDNIIKAIFRKYGTDPNFPFKRDVNGELDEESKDRLIEQYGFRPHRTLVLNFNYTSTFDDLYGIDIKWEKTDGCGELPNINNIHGELKNTLNRIIFGYGDDLDDDYREIEKINDNDFLENIKSIQYQNTRNYRNLLDFLQEKSFQVYIMGHSCGNSDRTLLNTIFEHPNCASIKPFYWVKKDGTDDYTNIIKNISRNFTNKQNMREIVVNKNYCKPLKNDLIIAVYPNPVSDILNIKIGTQIGTQAQLKHKIKYNLCQYDDEGTTLHNLRKYTKDSTVQFDVSKLPNGTYELTISGGVNIIRKEEIKVEH